MSEISLVPASKDSLQIEARTWAERVRDLVISDADSCVQASYLLRSIKGVRNDVQRWFDPHIEAAQDTKRKADAARKALVDECERIQAPLVTAEQTVKRALLAWEEQQERRRRDEEARLQAEAQRQAEEATLAAAAELERVAVKTGDAEMLEEATSLLEQPFDTPAVSVKTFVPKVQGVVYRDNWKAHPVVNVRALAAAVASGAAPASFLTPNMTAINQWIRSTQGAMDMPGVQIFNDRQIAARG